MRGTKRSYLSGRTVHSLYWVSDARLWMQIFSCLQTVKTICFRRNECNDNVKICIVRLTFTKKFALHKALAPKTRLSFEEAAFDKSHMNVIRLYKCFQYDV